MVGKNCKCRGTGEAEGWAQARWIHIHSCVIATSGCSCRNECLCNICSCLEVEITFLVSRAVLLTCWLQLITQIHNCSFSYTGTRQVHAVYKIRTWRAVLCVMSSVPTQYRHYLYSLVAEFIVVGRNSSLELVILQPLSNETRPAFDRSSKLGGCGFLSCCSLWCCASVLQYS